MNTQLQLAAANSGGMKLNASCTTVVPATSARCGLAPVSCPEGPIVVPFASCSAAPGGASSGLGARVMGVLVAGTLAASRTTCAGDAESGEQPGDAWSAPQARDKAGVGATEAPWKGGGNAGGWRTPDRLRRQRLRLPRHQPCRNHKPLTEDDRLTEGESQEVGEASFCRRSTTRSAFCQTVARCSFGGVSCLEGHTV